MPTLQDRFIATLLGVHIGDSYWAPHENQPRSVMADRVAKQGEFRSYAFELPGPDDYDGQRLPAGRPTDDSDQTADLCYSLLQCDGLDTSHLKQALRMSAIDGKSRLWDGKAFGSGRSTRAMLGDDEAARQTAMANAYATNGSLMRSAPMALWLGPTPDNSYIGGTDLRQVSQMSFVTHSSHDSAAACWLYVRMLRNALADNRDVGDVEIQCDLDSRIFAYLHNVQNHGMELPPDPGSFKDGWADAEYTLKVALHALWTTNSFVDCIRKVGLAGGDTDTYGAVAGGLAGAIYGTRGIPKDWQNIVLGGSQMKMYAESIYSVRMKVDA